MDTIQYPTLIKINEMYPQMTQSQQQLATYILENPSIVVNTSITDLMSHTNFRSEASDYLDLTDLNLLKSNLHRNI